MQRWDSKKRKRGRRKRGREKLSRLVGSHWNLQINHSSDKIRLFSRWKNCKHFSTSSPRLVPWLCQCPDWDPEYLSRPSLQSQPSMTHRWTPGRSALELCGLWEGRPLLPPLLLFNNSPSRKIFSFEVVFSRIWWTTLRRMKETQSLNPNSKSVGHQVCVYSPWNLTCSFRKH